MANKRLSELQALTSNNVKSADLFYVVDTATSILEGKKITALEVKNYVLSNGVITASISNAILSQTSSYINPLSVGLIRSASYSITSSFSDRSLFSHLSNTASYIDAEDIFGTVPSSSVSNSASYVIYRYGNGTVENSKTASYVESSRSSSYIIYIPDRDNGTVKYSVTSSHALNVSVTSSYLYFNGSRPNGTASYSNYSSSSLSSSYVVSSSYSLSSSYSRQSYSSLFSNTSSYIWYQNKPNGTASFAISSSRSETSYSSSYLYYNGITPNGTASYSLVASSSLSSSYALSASYASNASRCVTASYALSASYDVLDPSFLRTYGPYNTTDGTYGTQTSTELSYRNFIISPPLGTTTTIIVTAVCDVKVPITTTDTDDYTLELIVEDWTDGSLVWSSVLDTSRPNHYVNLSITGAFSLSGYTRQSTKLESSTSPLISGSWYTFRVKASNGATFDANSLLRGATFFIFTKPDTILTKTTYPPF